MEKPRFSRGKCRMHFDDGYTMVANVEIILSKGRTLTEGVEREAATRFGQSPEHGVRGCLLRVEYEFSRGRSFEVVRPVGAVGTDPLRQDHPDWLHPDDPSCSVYRKGNQLRLANGNIVPVPQCDMCDRLPRDRADVEGFGWFYSPQRFVLFEVCPEHVGNYTSKTIDSATVAPAVAP